MNGLPAILLSTRGTPIVSGEVVDRLGASEEGILLGAPLSHSLLACEYAIRVLLAAADPSLRSQLVTGHSSASTEEIAGFDELDWRVTTSSISAECARFVYARVARYLDASQHTETTEGKGRESIPRTAFLFPGALDWLDGPAPYLEKLKIVMALARTAFAFAHLTRALSYLEVKVDGRSAGAIPKITESLAFDLASAIDFCPELVVLIDEHVATRIDTLAKAFGESYVQKLRHANPDTVFFDPSTTIASSALCVIGATGRYLRGVKGSAADVRKAVEMHGLLLYRNESPMHGRRYLDASQLTDLVFAPSQADRWPLGLPEVEQVAKECLIRIASTGQLANAASAGAGSWISVETINRQQSIALRLPPIEHFVHAHKVEHMTLAGEFRAALVRGPLVPWLLYPSNATGISPFKAFTGTPCGPIAKVLGSAVEDAEQCARLNQLSLAIGTGTIGAVAPVLLEALLGDEGVKAVPTLSAALGGVFASWLSWVVSAKTRSS